MRGLLLTALFFIAIVTTDLPFLAGVVAAGGQPLWVGAIGFVLWAVISQLSLAVLCVALAMGRGQGFVRWLQRVWARLKVVLHGVIPVACWVICASLVVDIVLHVAWLGLNGL